MREESPVHGGLQKSNESQQSDTLLFPHMKDEAPSNARREEQHAPSRAQEQCLLRSASQCSKLNSPLDCSVPHMKDEVPSGGRREQATVAAEPALAVEAPAPTVEAPVSIDFSKVVVEPLFEDEVDFETFSKSDFRVVKVKECVAVPKSKKLLQFTLDDGTGADRTILSGIHAYYEPEELMGKTLVAITNLPPRKMMGIYSCGMIISAVHAVEGEAGEPEERLNLLMVDDRIPAGAKLY